MKYIKVFTDFAKAMEPLGDAERGRLFKAMLKYAETGDTPEFCGNERFIWPTAKSNIDRDQESYDRICQRNRSNRNNQSSPVVTSRHQSSRHVQDKDKDKDKDSVLPDGSTARAKRFTPPSAEEIAAYCRERKNRVDPQRFLDFYAAKDWMIGKNRMKDWRAAVRTWEQRDGTSQPGNTCTQKDFSDALIAHFMRGEDGL